MIRCRVLREEKKGFKLVRKRKIHLLVSIASWALLAVLLLIVQTPSSAQNSVQSLAQNNLPTSSGSQGTNRLGAAEFAVKGHIDRVLQELPAMMPYGEQAGRTILRDGELKQWFGNSGPREHPWANFGNPNSELDYFLDSFLALDARAHNAMNWSQAWSCFEPKLLAKADSGRTIVNVAGPRNEDLIAECRSKCINQVQHIPFERGNIIGAIMYRAFGCVSDPDPWGYIDNGYEIAEYWFPEYQVSINNYGINRISPERLSPTGNSFTRRGLNSQKPGVADGEILRGIAQSYPLNTSGVKLLQPRSDPYLGRGMSAAFATTDHEDKLFGHVIRSWLSANMGDRQLQTDAGWEVDPESSLFDAMPEPRAEHDPVNIWTEYGMFEAITSIPHFSYRIRPDIMNALFGSQRPYTTTAVQQPAFWQSQGATAYRSSRWPAEYGPLQTNFEIRPDTSDALKEAVYKGGHELFPLVTNLSGFGSPALSTAAIIARRVLYLAGARAPMELGGDQQGAIAGFFPQGAEQGRIMTYTINKENKAREIDKLQLTAPKRIKEGTTFGGVPPMVSECFRSQNIPNLVNLNPKLQQWVDRNLPRKLVGAYSDIDLISQQGGDVTFTYWNRRIGCFCDRCGLPTGSSPIADGGDGDKLYDRDRIAYCRYPLLPQMTPWSAWSRRDTFQECQRNGQNESFYDGTGMRDDV